MTARGAWLACLVLGVPLIVLFAISALTAMPPCGGKGSAVILLEMARTTADLRTLFGTGDCAAPLIAVQRKGVWIDIAVLIPVYTLFLCFGAWAARGAGKALALAAIAMTVAAALLDQVENRILFRILDGVADLTYPDTLSVLFDPLFWTVRPKFALLALAGAAIGLLLWRGDRGDRVAGGVLVAGGLVSLAMLFIDPRHSLMALGIFAGWIALLATAARHFRRPLAPLPQRA